MKYRFHNKIIETHKGQISFYERFRLTPGIIAKTSGIVALGEYIPEFIVKDIRVEEDDNIARAHEAFTFEEVNLKDIRKLMRSPP